MDPLIIAAALAAGFALVALLSWRRALTLEKKVGELEAALAASKELAQAKPVEVPRESEVVPKSADRPEPREITPEPPAAEPEEAEPEEAEPEEAEPEEAEAGETSPEEPEASGLEAPRLDAQVAEGLEPEPPAPSPEPARLRLAALKVVSDAFELARYLDFDAIVEKPSTYRVTVPITAANGEAVRYLEDGMFSCLSQVRIEDGSAILHIDTGKGPP